MPLAALATPVFIVAVHSLFILLIIEIFSFFFFCFSNVHKNERMVINHDPCQLHLLVKTRALQALNQHDLTGTIVFLMQMPAVLKDL